MRPLTPHAVVLGTIAALVLAWGPLGLALPDLDALLAPGGASLPSLLGTGALQVEVRLPLLPPLVSASRLLVEVGRG